MLNEIFINLKNASIKLVVWLTLEEVLHLETCSGLNIQDSDTSVILNLNTLHRVKQ